MKCCHSSLLDALHGDLPSCGAPAGNKVPADLREPLVAGLQQRRHMARRLAIAARLRRQEALQLQPETLCDEAIVMMSRRNIRQLATASDNP